MAGNGKKTYGRERASDTLSYFLILCPFFTGLAADFAVGLTGVFLAIALLVRLHAAGGTAAFSAGQPASDGETVFPRNGRTTALFLFVLSALLSLLLPVIRGYAGVGLLRVLFLLVFVLFLLTCSEGEKEKAFFRLPDTAAAYLILSAFLAVIPDAKNLVLSGSRLTGFFGYANTTALFFLLALVIGADEKMPAGKSRLWSVWVRPALLFAGILWTGSRLTFVLALLVLIFLAVKRSGVRLPFLIILIGGTGAAAVYGLVSGRVSSVSRFLTISASESTLLGRLLYWTDALPVIGTHPFGLGYLGYLREQVLFQHGVYSVRYLHSDWLQAAMDYGWIALAALAFLFLANLRRLRGSRRLLLLLLGLHMAFDFDLQFLYMGMLAALCMDWTTEDSFSAALRKAGERKRESREGAGGSGRAKNDGAGNNGGRSNGFSAGQILLPVFLWVFLGVSACFGLQNFLANTGSYEAALAMGPWDAETEERLLTRLSDELSDMTGDALVSVENASAEAAGFSGTKESASGTAASPAELRTSLEKHCDHLIAADADSAYAYLIRARLREQEGDTEGALDDARAACFIERYTMARYEDYILLIGKAMDEYEAAGDEAGLADAKARLKEVAGRREEVKETTNPLAYRIKDKPDFSLSQEAEALLSGAE